MLFARLGPIIYRRPDELIAYARNPRKHPERQIVALMASISEFGFNMPILVDGDSQIIAGDARLQAAKRLGLPEVPTISATHLSPAQVKAYRLADNRVAELGLWDMKALAIEIEEIISLDEIEVESIGWSTAELDVLLIAPVNDAGERDPADAQIEPPLQPVARPGDLWLLGQHRLLCGSALDDASWHRLLDGKMAAMSFGDPPFNVKVGGHVSGLGKVKHAEFAMASGEMSQGEFTDFLSTYLAAIKRHLRDGAVIDICMDWRHLRELHAAIDDNQLSLLNICIWNKTNGGMGSLYRSKHEIVAVTKVGTAPHINNVELGKHGRYRTNVWDYAGVNSFGAGRMQDLADHPTVKPVALVADAIRDVTCKGEIVLDPFMGSGTTLLAADRAGRLGYGTEIEPRFVDVAIRRWQELTGGVAVLADTGQSWEGVAAERLLLRDDASGADDIEQGEACHVAA
jgi:DNA modification methylase